MIYTVSSGMLNSCIPYHTLSLVIDWFVIMKGAVLTTALLRRLCCYDNVLLGLHTSTRHCGQQWRKTYLCRWDWSERCLAVHQLQRRWFALSLSLDIHVVDWHCWLGDRKDIRPVKKLGVGLLVVIIRLKPCTSCSSSCYHHLHHP